MTTLVLAPGLLCDAYVWQNTLAEIDTMPCHVADFSHQNSLVKMAQDTLDAVPGKLAVAGFSMGGRVALEMFRLAPERVTKLAFLDVAVTPMTPEEVAPRQELVRTAQSHGMQALCEAWLPNMVHPDRHGDVLMGDLKAMVLRSDPDLFARQIEALLTRPDVGDLIRTISTSTLVLCGRQDNFSTPEMHRQLAAALQDPTLVVIENAGHFALVERPAPVTKALQDWIAT